MSPITQPFSQSLRPIKCMPAQRDQVYLSFDDGPDVEWTPRVLDLLSAAGVHATFFMVGCHALATPALVRRVLAEGHAIGNHSYSHRHPWTLSTEAARREVRDGAAAIANITGQSPAVFRPPHGRLRRCMINEAEASGQAIVLWNRSAIDWGPFGTASRIAARLSHVQAGDIVLMHDARNTHNKPDELTRILPSFLQDLPTRKLHCALLAAG